MGSSPPSVPPTPLGARHQADHDLAMTLAVSAGRMLVALRNQLVAEGITGAALGDAGDQHSQRLLAAELQRSAPGDAVLSEEAADDLGRLDAQRLWVVDPLDGTREYCEPERTDWAVHVALVSNGQPVAAAVHMPATDLVFSTGTPTVVPPPPSGRTRLIVSRTHPPAATAALADALEADILTLGSAGAKTMAVVQGVADIYIHDAGLHEWDSCAPVAVARASGLHASLLDGSDLQYNQRVPRHGDLLVCRPELAEAALEALRPWT
jgi:3'(2'), 5'-bisphosphate nucleotidase